MFFKIIFNLQKNLLQTLCSLLFIYFLKILFDTFNNFYLFFVAILIHYHISFIVYLLLFIILVLERKVLLTTKFTFFIWNTTWLIFIGYLVLLVKLRLVGFLCLFQLILVFLNLVNIFQFVLLLKILLIIKYFRKLWNFLID